MNTVEFLKKVQVRDISPGMLIMMTNYNRCGSIVVAINSKEDVNDHWDVYLTLLSLRNEYAGIDGQIEVYEMGYMMYETVFVLSNNTNVIDGEA